MTYYVSTKHTTNRVKNVQIEYSIRNPSNSTPSRYEDDAQLTISQPTCVSKKWWSGYRDRSRILNYEALGVLLQGFWVLFQAFFIFHSVSITLSMWKSCINYSNIFSAAFWERCDYINFVFINYKSYYSQQRILKLNLSRFTLPPAKWTKLIKK